MKSFKTLLSEIALTPKSQFYQEPIYQEPIYQEPKPMTSDELHTHIMKLFDKHRNIPHHKIPYYVALVHHEVESNTTPIEEIEERVEFYASGKAGI